jgi:hypothetical protein
MHTLSKFEQLHFVHVFAPGSSTAGSSSSKVQAVSAGTCFELPRFGLTFELQQDGVLASKDYSGYVLAEQQLLVSQQQQQLGATASQYACTYTLPEFTQYLVLQSRLDSSSSSSAGSAAQPGAGRSSTLVLVPAGGVCRSGSSSGRGHERIDINLDGASGAALNVSGNCTLLVATLCLN